MPDPFTNARPYFDVSFPSSGDGFSISGFRNNFAGLGFMDMIPMQPRAHNPANTSIMVRGRDASSFYNPVYFGDADKRTFFGSGDSPTIAAPASNPRIDIVYVTPSGDIRVVTGTEAANPTLPSLAPSGDTRIPVCAIYNRVGQTKIVNFEDKDSNTGDGYIYQDLRPWLKFPSAGTGLSAVTPVGLTGDGVIGTATTAARADHTHQGVRAIRKVGSSNLYGEVEIAGGNVVQAGNRLTINGLVEQMVFKHLSGVVSGTPGGALTRDDSIPQTSEVVMLIEASITPKNAGNDIIVYAFLDVTAAGAAIGTIGVWKDAGAGAVAARGCDFRAAGQPGDGYIAHREAAGSTTPRTYKIGVGSNGGTEITLNGDAGARRYGGVASSFLLIVEVAPMTAG